MAADSQRREQFVNPCLLHLQKMELELKCPSCLKLLNNPILLPCDHVCCSSCITSINVSSVSCPACASPFISQDLRVASHIAMIVSIFKSMRSTFSAYFLQPEGQLTTPEKNVGGSTQGMKSSVMQSGSSLKNACITQETYSPPSYGDVKGSDSDINDFKSGQLFIGSCKRKLGDATARQGDPDENGICNKKINHGNMADHTNSEICVKEFKNSSESQICNSTSGVNLIDNNGSKSDTPDMDCMISSKPTKDETPVSSNGATCSSDAVSSLPCVFCHSSTESAGSGPMLHYDNGNPVGKDHAHKSNVAHVHEKCIEWAPQVYFVGDVAKGLEAEVSRASKIKCSECGKKGAALGCYAKSCRKSFHVPCATEIPGCRWDTDDFLVLCPAHTSHKFPSDRSKNKKKATFSPHTCIQKPSRDLGVEVYVHDNSWESSADATQGWVLCGSALSTAENALLAKFAKITGASISRDWTENVTHVIASTDESGACMRTFKYLMAILGGKWVLRLDWINACLEAKRPLAEEGFEIKCDNYGCLNGPKNGRMRIMEKAPPLFNGTGFYLSGKFRSSYQRYIEGLISVAGGSILDDSASSSGGPDAVLPTSFVICNMDPPDNCDPAEQASVIKKRVDEAEILATKSGSQVVAHTWILECIAACKILDNRLL